MHLVMIHLLVQQHSPANVIIDPATNLTSTGTQPEVRAMMMRMIDYLKGKGITTMVTTLTSGGSATEQTEIDISSLIDTWILLRDIESAGERNRGIYILKSRGMAHSNQIREFRMTGRGIELLDAYLGGGSVLTGSARVAQERRDREEEGASEQEEQHRMAQMKAEQTAIEAQIAALQSKLTAHEQAMRLARGRESRRRDQLVTDRREMARMRRADAVGNGEKQKRGRK